MKWLKRIGIAIAGIVVLVCVAVVAVYAITSKTWSRTYDVTGKVVRVRTDSATIATGRHLAMAVVKCVDCHGPDLGGSKFIDDPGLGLLVASNLTAGKGGVLRMYDDAKLERAIRHGVRSDGQGLRIMPSYQWQHLADDDLAAIIAYVRSVPPVDRELPETELKLLARVLNVAGQFPLFDAMRIDHTFTSPASVPFGVTKEYGAYQARVSGCIGCHGETLSGGKIPGTPPEWPPAANLTPTGLAAYKEADFTTLLRTGVRPSGVKVSDVMPWRFSKDLTDGEIKALWLYLQTVPKKEFGGR